MNTTLATTAPRFHSLTGTQPVGQTQVATMAEYAGSITTVTRLNGGYWKVVTRSARNAFRPGRRAFGMGAAIWIDQSTGQFVVDYWNGTVSVEADRTRTLRAAIGVACDVTAQHWANAQ